MEIEANVEDESSPSFASSNWENRSPVEIPAALTGVLLLQSAISILHLSNRGGPGE
jgi:hypothetical protein